MGFSVLIPHMKCEDCGTERWKLHRHHIIPKSLGGLDDPSNIKCLCANCHEDRHRDGAHKANTLAHTPEAKAKRAASLKRRWKDLDYRAQQHESRKQVWADHTPEKRRQRSEATSKALKGKPFTTEHLEAVRTSHRTLEYREQARLRILDQTPEQKAQRLAKFKATIRERNSQGQPGLIS
jgi:HNH endonuclease